LRRTRFIIMFDIGFSELFLVAFVALVVLGPERLPKAARFAGLWVRRARAQWYSVKSELERELAAEELQRTLRDTRQAVADIDAEVRQAGAEARREFETMKAQVAHDDRQDDSNMSSNGFDADSEIGPDPGAKAVEADNDTRGGADVRG
jgi:sec-independent protein translocase protein TatB